jgi:hypothetical protein
MASLATLQPATIETLDQRLSVAQIQARRKAIQELLRTTMRKDVDFGTIPGTPKPTLYKPGAEKICSLFQLAPRITVHDMGTPDTIRYQCKVELYTVSGAFCGEGIGTASSAETKYQWRAAVCREEYDATADDRRRLAYKKSREGFYTVIQVRTEPEDADNTVLKMAKKRGLIDAVLTVTAASDIFTQDIEDDDMEPQGSGNSGGQGTQPQTGQTRQQAAPQGQQGQQAQQRPANGPAVISDAQMRRFHAKATNAGKTADEVKRYLYEEFNIEHSRDIPKSGYDRACDWADRRTQAQPQQQDGDYPPDEMDEPGYQGQF